MGKLLEFDTTRARKRRKKRFGDEGQPISLDDRREEKMLRHEHEAIDRQKERIAEDFSVLARGGTVQREVRAYRGYRRARVTPRYLAKLLDAFTSRQRDIVDQLQTSEATDGQGRATRRYDTAKAGRTHEWLERRGHQ